MGIEINDENAKYAEMKINQMINPNSNNIQQHFYMIK